MLVGLATLARAADPADPFIQHDVLDSAAAKLAIGSVHGQPARELFRMIIGQVEAMRDEMGELRADNSALIERLSHKRVWESTRIQPST
jgi:hypothetical protein